MESFLATVAELNNPDQRAFLYSDLDRQKIDNPDGYKEAVAFWSRLLNRACQRGLLSTAAHPASSADGEDDGEEAEEEEEEEDVLDRINKPSVDMPSALTIDRRLLTLRLVFRGDTPMGLDSVIDDMQRTGVLVPADDYFAPAIRRWAKWLAARLLPQAIATRGPPAVLVATASVQEVASRVVAAHRARVSCPLTDNIMSVDDFRRTYGCALVPDSKLPKHMSVVDAHVLLKYLVDTRHAATSAQLMAHPPASPPGHVRGTDLVKFASTSPPTITDADFATYQVVCTHRLLAHQVSALEARVSGLDAEVRDALRRQQRPVAAARLRLKRHIESNILTKRVAALETVEHVVLQLQQTSSDLQLMQTLSAGTRALRALNDEAKEIDPDSVADAWEEEAVRAAELGAALDDTQAVVVPDDLDVEAELEALIAMDAAKDIGSKEQVEDDVDALADSIGKVEIAGDIVTTGDAVTTGDIVTTTDPVANNKPEEATRVAVPAE
ncbi:Charged multivesicular body protein 7 [Coemansia sp. S146]|nr:Charged multivesicular body protein 7 [Coemansia sp. S146]